MARLPGLDRPGGAPGPRHHPLFPGHQSGARTIAPRRKRSYPMSNQYDPGQAPTATFPAVPGPAQPTQEYVRLHEGGTARPAADDRQPDGTPAYTGNSRPRTAPPAAAARPAVKKGSWQD